MPDRVSPPPTPEDAKALADAFDAWNDAPFCGEHSLTEPPPKACPSCFMAELTAACRAYVSALRPTGGPETVPSEDVGILAALADMECVMAGHDAVAQDYLAAKRNLFAAISAFASLPAGTPSEPSGKPDFQRLQAASQNLDLDIGNIMRRRHEPDDVVFGRRIARLIDTVREHEQAAGRSGSAPPAPTEKEPTLTREMIERAVAAAMRKLSLCVGGTARAEMELHFGVGIIDAAWASLTEGGKPND